MIQIDTLALAIPSISMYKIDEIAELDHKKIIA